MRQIYENSFKISKLQGNAIPNYKTNVEEYIIKYFNANDYSLRYITLKLYT